jgi:hypothetical protein
MGLSAGHPVKGAAALASPGSVQSLTNRAVLPSGMGEESAQKDQDGAALIGLQPGTMQLLLPGEDIKFSDPADVGGSYESFQSAPAPDQSSLVKGADDLRRLGVDQASVIGPRMSIPHACSSVTPRGSCFCPWSAPHFESRHMMRSDGAGEPISTHVVRSR